MEDNEIRESSFQNNSLLNTSNLITVNTALQKTYEYFLSHDYLTKQELEFFIKFIGLDMVWTTADDYETFWSCLLKHKSQDNMSSNPDQISKNEAIKGVTDLTTVSTSNSSSLLFNSVQFNQNDISSQDDMNTTSHLQVNSYIEILNEFAYEKLIDIRNVLMLLRLNPKTKTTVHYKTILNIINKYNSILSCNFNDVEKVIISLEDNHSITSSEYEINPVKYEQLLKDINTILKDDRTNNNNKMNIHNYKDSIVNLILRILKHHMINYPENIDVDNCVYVLNNYYLSKEQNALNEEVSVPKGNDTSLDINTSLNNSNNKISIIGKDGKQILLTNQHTVKPINENIFTNKSPLQPVSLHNSVNVIEKETSKEVTTIKIDDVSNSRCDLFSLHDNKDNDNILFDTTNGMDNSVRLPNNISEIENEISKFKPQMDFSTSFDKGKLSFLSISNINDKNKKENEVKEEEKEEEHVHRNTNIINEDHKYISNNNMNSNSNNNNNLHNNNNNLPFNQLHSNANSNLTQRISINSNNNNNISNMRSRNSHNINNTRVKDSRSTMSLSRLRNEDFSNILLSEAGQNTCYDFLSLKDNPSIMKMLETNSENENTFEFYSNTVYYFDQNEKKKFILLITSINIFILDPLTYAVTKRIRLKNLKKLTISNKNCNLLVFHFDDEVNNDLILEILRRIELLFYFRDLYKFKGYSKLQIKIANKFKIKKNFQYVNMQVSNNLSKKFLITPNFENAIKIGYLYQYKQGLFKPTLKERLLVLTGVGLLIFDQPNEAPKAIVAIIGNEIKKIDHKEYGIYGFQIKNSKGEVLIFGTHNQTEFKSWYDGFKLLKNAYDNKLKYIDPVSNKKKGGWDY